MSLSKWVPIWCRIAELRPPGCKWRRGDGWVLGSGRRPKKAVKAEIAMQVGTALQWLIDQGSPPDFDWPDSEFIKAGACEMTVWMNGSDDVFRFQGSLLDVLRQACEAMLQQEAK